MRENLTRLVGEERYTKQIEQAKQYGTMDET